MSIFNYMTRSSDVTTATTESTKRPLSTGSSPGAHDAKKPNTEKSPSPSPSLSDAAAEFDADTPYWVPLIFAAVDQIQRDMTKVIAKVDELADFKAELSTRMTDLETSVKFVADEHDKQKADLDAFRARLTAVEAENQKLRAAHDGLKNDHELLTRKADTNEQHSRNECLLLHGVGESEHEDVTQKIVNVINTNLGHDVEKNTIRRAHRLGAPRTDGKPRPIIARFWHMGLRNKIYASKKKLKGLKMLLTENLTVRRLSILNEGRDKYGSNNVWSQEGRIYADNGHSKICLCN